MPVEITPFAFYADKLCATVLLCGGLVFFWRNRRDFRIRLAVWVLAGFLLLFSVMRGMLFFSFQDLFALMPAADIWAAWAWGMRYDLCAASAAGSVFVLAFLLPVHSRRYYQIAAGFCAAVWTLAAAACAGDLVYFSFVKRHTGSEILLAIYDAELLASLASSQYFWAGAVLAVLGGVLIWLAVRYAGRQYAVPLRADWRWTVGILLTAALLFFAFRGQFGFRFKPLTVSEAYEDGNLARGNLALNGLFCIYKSISSKTAGVSEAVSSEEALKRAQRLLASAQQHYISADYPLLRMREQFNVQGRNFNVVIILVESWQYRYTDALAGTQYGATPVLDGLARQSLVFDRFYASGQRSINGAGAVMSGVAQLQGLPYFSLGLESYRFTGLAGLLAQRGYRTVFAQPADWNSARVGLVAQITGFEEIYSKSDMRSLGNYVHPGTVSDYDGLMALADKLKDSQKPFFALFFTAAMHPPYGPLHRDFTRFAWDGPDKGYLNMLNYTDWAIGQFIKRLKEQGQYKNTVFFILADHTLGWGESGSFEDRFHIPFIIHAPALFAADRIDKTGSQADILPTVLDIVNLSVPYAAMGNSLLDNTAEHFAFTSQDGRILGFVQSSGTVEHTGTARVQSGEISTAGEEAERDLLSLNRAVYDLLVTDRWAP